MTAALYEHHNHNLTITITITSRLCGSDIVSVVVQVTSWLQEVGEVGLKRLDEPEDSLELLNKKQKDFKDFRTAAYVCTHIHSNTLSSELSVCSLILCLCRSAVNRARRC